MPSSFDIDRYFSNVNLNFQKLLEFLPIGTIFFNEKWNVITINSAAVSYLSLEPQYEIPDNANLFYDNFLSQNLPLNKIFRLKDGISFEEDNGNIYTSKTENKKFVIKGIPLFSNNAFQGGVLILLQKSEIFSEKSEQTASNQLLLHKILKQIYPCYIITELEGQILVKSEDEYLKCNHLDISVGKSILEVFNNAQQDIIKQKILKTISEKQNTSLELRYYSANESYIYNTVIIPLINESNEVKSLLFLLKEKNKINNDAVDLLSNSKELNDLKSFALAGYDAFFKTNLIGIINYWSDKSVQLFNKEKDSVLGKKIEEIFPQINKSVFEKLRNDLITNKYWEIDFEFNNGDDDFDVITKVKLFKNNNINEILFFCDKVDIHEQKLKLAKEEENNFFKNAVVKSDEIILQANQKGVILFANEKFCNLFGFEIDEIRGVYFLDLIEENYRLKNDLSDFSGSIYKKSFENLPLFNKSGKVAEYNCSINISLEETNLKYFIIYLKEINYNKDIQLEISDSLLNSFPNPVILLKQNSVIKYNSKFEDYFNISWNLLNNNFSNYISEESKEDFDQFINNSKLLSASKPIKLVLKENNVTEVIFKKLNSDENSENIVLEVLPKKEEEKVKVEDLDDEEFKNFAPVIWKSKIENNEVKIDSISDSIEELTEYEKESFLLYKTLWKDILYPDDSEKTNNAIQDFLKNDQNYLELQYRIIKKNGAVVWLNNKIKKIKNDDGTPEKIIGLITDITDTVLKQEKIDKKLNELAKLNETKDKFISIISHDLKAPFTSIVGFAELGLADTKLTIEELREYVGFIKDASLHTLDLVNGLLDWTRLQTGRLQVRTKSINAKYLAQKTIELLNGVAAQKDISLNTEIDESIFIQADTGILSQVFNNLVSNALKFTPKGGKIEITAKQLDDQNKIEFNVKDTGVGIEEEDIKKLFNVDEKFTTLGTEGERGTGLGLSLVKEIIEKHNGKISVKSEVGKGTEFIFTIPMSSPSILIIDDKKSESLIYSKLVRNLTEGITIFTASDFEEAGKLITEKVPMLVISESEIEGRKVSEFYETIAKGPQKYKPSFFILSRYMSDEDFEKCRTLGIDVIQPKPIDTKLLKSILDKFILGHK